MVKQPDPRYQAKEYGSYLLIEAWLITARYGCYTSDYASGVAGI